MWSESSPIRVSVFAITNQPGEGHKAESWCEIIHASKSLPWSQACMVLAQTNNLSPRQYLCMLEGLAWTLSSRHDANPFWRAGEFSHMDVSCAMLFALRELAITHFISCQEHGTCVPEALDLCTALSDCASKAALCQVSGSFRGC